MVHWPISLPSTEEMSSYDSLTIAQGIPEIDLVERAGKALTWKLLAHFSPRSLFVLCGSGNNGADGLVIARQFLSIPNRHVQVLLVHAIRYSSSLIDAARKFQQQGGTILMLASSSHQPPPFSVETLDIDLLKRKMEQVDVCVDALLGTGQKEPPRKEIAAIVSLLTLKRKFQKIVSIDIPTGCDASTGQVFQPHVRADLTLSIEFIKRGLLQWPAREIGGEIDLVSIGIQPSHPSEFSLLDDRIRSQLHSRKMDAHKGDFGHVLVIGGSQGMDGAPGLTALSAIRSGAALVTQLTRQDSILFHPEFMSLSTRCKGCFDVQAIESLRSTLDRFQAVIIGPGLGQHSDTEVFLNTLFELIRERDIPSVVDADGLNLLAKNPFLALLPSAIITPHPGEAARLLGTSVSEIQQDRFSAVQALSKKFGVIAVLKGAGTLIWGSKEGVLNTSGTPYLATGGSGDVLAGVVGGLLAQGYSSFQSAQLGTYLHGIAGELAVERLGGPIIASDIIDSLPQAIGLPV